MSDELKIVLEDVKEKFDTVVEAVNMVRGSLERFRDENKQEHEELRGDIQGLQADMGTAKKDIHGLKSDMVTVKGDVQELKSDVGTTKKDIQGLKSDMVTVKGDLQDLKSDTTSIRQDLNDHRTNTELHTVKSKGQVV